MSSGVETRTGLEIAEGQVDLPTDPGRTRIRRQQGVLQLGDPLAGWQPVGVGGWYDRQQMFIKSLIPQLTHFDRYKPPMMAIAQAFPAGLSDSAMEGGGVKATNVAGGVVLQNITTFQTMKTTRWGFSFAFQASAITAGQFALAGFANSAINAFVMFGHNQSESATNWVFRFFDGAVVDSTATTIAADTNPHTATMVSDATTVSCYIDGVLGGTKATSSTRLIDGPRLFAMIASATGVINVGRLITGVVDPYP